MSWWGQRREVPVKKVKPKVKAKKARVTKGPSWQQVSSHQNAGLDVILERLDEIKAILTQHDHDGVAVDPEPDEKVNESEMPDAPTEAAA
jgi:hypothetical protein